MSSAKPLLRALRQEVVWPPPIWLMRQAGRYLPEYRAVRASVSDFITLCTAPELAAEATLQPIRRYRFDGGILFSDILMVPWALGQGLEFRAGEGPVLPPLRRAEELARLDIDRARRALAPVNETVRRVSRGLQQEGFSSTTLIGFAGAPFTVACYMVEGAGSRDFPATRSLAYQDPALFERLIELVTQTTIEYLAGQIEAGAEAVMLFDSWAGLLSPTQFQAHVIRPTGRIIASLKARYPMIPIVGFPRLAGTMIGAYANVGVNAVALDSSIDLSVAARLMAPNVTMQGNLDPFAVLAGGEVMATEVRSILSTVRHLPFVFNLGHGIMPETPPDHVRTLVELVRGA
ncbi:MAG: uroporphyrinogen decarboxylase [Acetobacteraceae bacterium]|nr:uroporphyrinogen decarboxylase [Acetobacteraceae bacterium]